jgi:hypothetical protein
LDTGSLSLQDFYSNPEVQKKSGTLVIHEKSDTLQGDVQISDTIMTEGVLPTDKLESPVKKDRKRLKTGEDGAETNKDISAGPFEGYCREQ